MKSLTFILLHGAWHDAWCWHLLTPLLENHGHTVLTPDLPGHGRNRMPIDRISLNNYSRYTEQLIDNNKNNILLGHSMSGAVISQVAARKPKGLSALVYLCAYAPQPGQSIFSMMEELEDYLGTPTRIQEKITLSADKRTCTIAPEHRENLFYNCCPADLSAVAADRFCTQATLPLAGKLKAKQSSPAAPPVPAFAIECSQDRVLAIQHQRWMLQQQSFCAKYTLPSDHSPFLSSPAALAEILLKIAGKVSSCTT